MFVSASPTASPTAASPCSSLPTEKKIKEYEDLKKQVAELQEFKQRAEKNQESLYKV
jgi:hypothetical protein